MRVNEFMSITLTYSEECNDESIMDAKTYFIIDFDSTFVRIEGLEKLAEIALAENPHKEEILIKIKNITEKGMQGELSFDKSLQQRLSLFSADADDIKKLINVLRKNITPSILRNREFFKKYKDHIYIISGGFAEYILPIFKPFGIDRIRILANEFIFDKNKKIIGFNKKNLLSQKNGKIKQIKALKLQGKVYIIGDGFTDYQIKKEGLADKFFVFHENVKRDKVAEKADYLLPNFDEFLYLLDLPRAYSYPKHRMKVLLCENISGVASHAFKKEGYTVNTLAYSPSEKQLMELIKDVSILGIRSQTNIPGNILTHAKRLLCIGAYCIGTNQINKRAASLAGVAAFNAPYSNTRSVVELVIAEIIALSRKLIDKNNKLHKGIWDKSSSDLHEIRGKKLGIVGYGNIGSQLSVLAENLGMEVYFYDVVDKLTLGNTRKCSSLREVLKVADFITIHVDGREQNRNLIGEAQFRYMKNGVIFINSSRGYVVDLDALLKNIKMGKVAGAAIDVFPQEPKSNKEKFISRLQGLPNVILTPHIGGSTVEAQENIGFFVTEKILSFINTGNTTLSVNFPHIQLPQLRNAHRFIHTHQNVPGVLAKINGILAEFAINIEGQYLKTNEDIGYVITDVNKKYKKEVIDKLKKIAETIKFRVLY